MNFWEFLDKQIGRLRPDGVAGAGIFGQFRLLREDRKHIAG